MQSRVIKFRCWDKEEKRMYNDVMVGNSGTFVILSYTKQTKETDFEWTNTARDIQEFNNNFLMQFTGLNDCNGVEVYEGDIIHNTDTGENATVVYKDDGFITFYHDKKSFQLFHTLENLYTVAGNIYQNPELVEV